MALQGLANNPLLQTTSLVKVISEFDFNQDDYILAGEVPVRSVDTHDITVDVRKGSGGMTQAAKSGAESPTVGFYGASQFKFTPAEWREKVILTPEEMYKLRKLGTFNEVETAQSVIARHMADLRVRLENRLEWSRWQAFKGSLSYSKKDLNLSIDYHIPTELKPTLTGADKWDATTSDPLDDMLSWNEEYRDLVAKPEMMLFNSKMHRVLLQNSKIRTMRDNLFVGQPNMGNLTPGNLGAVLRAYLDIPYKVYDGGYFEYTDLVQAAVPGATTLYLRDVGSLAADDTLILTDLNGDVQQRERLTIATVNTTTNVITVDSPGLVGGYAAGSTIRCKKHFIADNEFILKGALPASIEGGPQWAEIISTVHPYGPDPTVPSSGIFAKPVIHEEDDPPKVEIIVGMYGLPVVYHRDVNMIATTY